MTTDATTETTDTPLSLPELARQLAWAEETGFVLTWLSQARLRVGQMNTNQANDVAAVLRAVTASMQSMQS